MRRLGRRARIAYTRRHLERAELHRLVHRYFEMRDAPSDLVESREDADRILNLLRVDPGCAEGTHGSDEQKEGDACVASSRFRVLHRAPEPHANPPALTTNASARNQAWVWRGQCGALPHATRAAANRSLM